MRKLETSPYTWALPQIAFMIQSELERRNWQAEFICDEGDKRKGGKQSFFAESTMFDEAHKTPQLSRLSPPVFRSSHSEVGLQIADIHAYCCMQAEAKATGLLPDNPKTRLLSGFAHQYSEKQVHLTQPNQELSEIQRLWRVAIVSEFIIQNSQGPQETRDTLWRESRQSLHRVAQQMYEGQNAHALPLINSQGTR